MLLSYRASNDHAPLRCEPSVAWLERTPLSFAPVRYTAWLHCANVVLERKENSDAIAAKVFDFWIERRRLLPKSHRKLVFFVLARSLAQPQAQAQAQPPANLLCSGAPVAEYSLSVLWTALHILLVSWKTLSYSPAIESYVRSLAARVGDFCFLKDAEELDHPAFCGRGGVFGQQQQHCINEKFLEETERAFYFLFFDLTQQALLPEPDEREAEAKLDPHAFAKWLEEATKVSAIRECVVAEFGETIYERRSMPGEVERFAEQDPHADATPYNAIARIRPDIIDNLAEIVDASDFLEKLLERITTDMDTDADLDAKSDLADLVVICTGYLLDAAFASPQCRFGSFFVATQLPLPASKTPFPMLVKVFHEWKFVFGGQTRSGGSGGTEAVFAWISCVANSETVLESIRHVAPHEEVFFQAFEQITGGKRSRVALQRQRDREKERMRLGLGFHF